MAKKTDYLNIRIAPGLKEALRKLAKNDRRTVSNMLELLILEKCEEFGINIEDLEQDE